MNKRKIENAQIRAQRIKQKKRLVINLVDRKMKNECRKVPILNSVKITALLWWIMYWHFVEGKKISINSNSFRFDSNRVTIFFSLCPNTKRFFFLYSFCSINETISVFVAIAVVFFFSFFSIEILKIDSIIIIWHRIRELNLDKILNLYVNRMKINCTSYDKCMLLWFPFIYLFIFSFCFSLWVFCSIFFIFFVVHSKCIACKRNISNITNVYDI